MQKINTRRANPHYPHPRMRGADPETLKKLLKEELRMTIMAKRQARGEEELMVEFHEPESHDLTASEVERKERRREQNRRAAQRCRRKKRQHQMSVLQNYEWIITHNQQLTTEVEQLRQQTSHLQTVLQAHRDACTCTHAHSKTASLQALAPKVKTEPAEDSALGRVGHRSVCHGLPSPGSGSHPVSSDSCVYGSSASEVGVVSESNASPTQAQCGGYSSLQAAGYYPTSSGSGPCGFETAPCSPAVGSYQQPPNHHHNNHYHNSNNLSSFSHNYDSSHSPHKPHQLGDATHTQSHHPTVHNNCHGSGNNLMAVDFAGPAPFNTAQVAGVPTSQPHTPQSAAGDTHLSLLEELAYLPESLRPCVFQEEAATPLSADGRRSISSVSSDVSTAPSDQLQQQQQHQQQHCSDVIRESQSDDVMMNDLATHDAVSQLLSQINQNDLIFHQDGAMDDVFADPAITSSLPEHFLQNI
ncbi:uncharacterized protein [Littorina saxatilis]|uniref:BZIP domain-containing protein n=1 Tax=Littorina saxatilis TaxID=31220 RepID=A0AAN9GDY9_9CAEN